MERPMTPAATLADLRPGDIGFGPLTGAARAAMWGQFVLGEGFSVSGVNIGHVFVVIEALDLGEQIYAPQVIEAMPRGARRAPIRDRWTGRYAYVRLPEDYPGQADDAAAIARAMIGTPYSFASYAALAAWRLGIKTPRLEKWINRRKPWRDVHLPSGARTGGPSSGMGLPCEAICSVLADQAWSLTGKKIMTGVAHQCVTPGALAGRLLRDDRNVWSWPSRESVS